MAIVPLDATVIVISGGVVMAGDGKKLLDLVADLAGDDVVDELLTAHGGSKVSVPFKAYPKNWLVKLIGLEVAQEVFDAFGVGDLHGHRGGVYVVLPIAERSAGEKIRREIWRRLKLGQSKNRIAREVGVSSRTVQRHSARLKKLAQRNSVSRTEGLSE